MVWEFSSPKVVFGEDAIDELESVVGKYAFIVTDNVINKLGYVEKVSKFLAAHNWAVAVWDCAEPDPLISKVKEAAEAMRRFGADTIVAIGGGSVIDTAKAAWILYERPDIDLRALTPFDDLNLRQKAKLVCIPTTAGTGSEATRAIVIRDDETGRKFATINSEILPDLAVLDPYFVKGLPKELTAYTGMDALTHAVEAYVSSWKNPYSDGLVMSAVKLVFEWLPKSVGDLDDMEAREKMMVAANLAGIAFSNSQVALGHSLGHSLGSVLRLQHGLCVGMALPNTIEFNSKESTEAAGMYAELAALVGISGEDDEKVSRQFANKIRELMNEIGSPISLKGAGVSKKDFQEGLDKLVEYTMMDTSLTMNPRDISKGEIMKIYEYMFEGKPIDF